MNTDGITWFDIPGATGNSYTENSLLPANNGWQFRVIYTNPVGNVTSNVAVLTVSSAPIINTSPSNANVPVGSQASFTANASGDPTPLVQWQVNDGSGWANVTTGTGGTTDNYTTANLTLGENGYQ
jgi:hypothetical protein